MELKKYTRLSLLLGLSVVLNILESFLPFFNGVMGFKLGLANTITLFVLYEYSLKDAFYVGILRVFLVGILRTGLFSVSFFLSLAGVLLSIITMFLAKKIKLSIIGVSVVGSLFHSLGQVILAIFLLSMPSMIYYLPWLLLFSIPTGILVGIITKQLVKYFENNLLLDETNSII